MNRIAFAVRFLLLLLPDVLDAVATQFPFDILTGSSDGLSNGVRIEHAKDTLTASSSGISVASETVAKTAGSQGGQQYDAASLESLAMGMAGLENTPGVQQGMAEIEKIVNDTLLGLYGNYWYQINREPELYNIWKASTDNCNYTKHDDPSIPSLAEAHYNCRQLQGEIQTEFDAATQCSPEYQRTFAGLRYARCNNFWQSLNVFPRDILPDTCKRHTDEVNQDYISRVVEKLSGLQQNWTESFTSCQAIIDAYANTTTYCNNLTAQLANKTAECDALQQQLDAVSCNLAQGENVTCGEYVSCWKAANDTYIRDNASIAATERDTEGEIRAMKRVRCICRALQLPQGDIDEQLAVCQNTTFGVDECLENLSAPNNYTCYALGALNFSFYLVDWNPPNTPTLPPANCSGGAYRPCTQAYVNTYFLGLPQNAPAAPSSVDCCTMCEYFDGCGADLNKPNYRDITGFDEETCCMSVKWVIGKWTPPLFGDQCPTGCGHTASYYNRSLKCVSEQGTPVPNSECIRAHGVGVATELTCTPTKDCTNCSACGWGYERQGCNTSATPPDFGNCVPCQKNLGSYFEQAGSCNQPKCGNCTIGHYRRGCQFSFGNTGTCTDCTEKLGTYFTGAGGFVDYSCPTANCTTCRNGMYNRGCKGTNAGTCDDCVGANDSGIVGYQDYYSGPGTTVDVNTSCPKKLCDYTRCPFGQVLTNCGGRNPGTCVDCQPECSQFRSQAACHKACSWNSGSGSTICEAVQYVVPGALGRCRFAPCEPRVCAAGQYLANCSGIRNGTCSPCNAPPTGHFFTGPGRYSPKCPSTECQNCSTGYFRANCSGANGGSCVACSAPPAGNYFTSHGYRSDSCPHAPCSGDRCKAGHYLVGCGGRDKGTCKTCTKHVAGKYFSSHGFLNNSCPTTPCNASQCAVGFYLRNCGGHLAPASAGSCQPCSAPPAGYYWTTNGGTNNHCRASRCFDVNPACPAGQYRKGCGGKGNATGTGYCAQCTNLAPGKFYMTGPGNNSGFCPQATCDALANCDTGHFRVGCGSPTDPTGKGNCSASCPAPHQGYYHYEGCLQKKCPACGAAQHRVGCGRDAQNHTSSGKCEYCANPPAGKYFDMNNNTGCTPQDCTDQKCGDGQYRTGCGNRSIGTCAQCNAPPPGYYIKGRGSLNATSCPTASCDALTPCAAGQWRKGCGTAALPMDPGRCGSCAQPPTGMYYSGPGNSTGNQTCPTKKCIDEASCPTGQYRYGCGTDIHSSYTGIGSCRPCTDPPSSYFLNTSGGINDSCTKTSCSGAPACKTGFYRKDCGGRSHPTGYGNCVRCSPPQADKYFISHGYLNDTCTTQTCAGECNIGEYRNNCGGENNPTSRGYCTNCTKKLLQGNVWLTDGDLSNQCSQGKPNQSTAQR